MVVHILHTWFEGALDMQLCIVLKHHLLISTLTY